MNPSTETHVGIRVTLYNGYEGKLRGYTTEGK